MLDTQAPGVYCQQVDSRSQPMVAAGTRVAGMAGAAPDPRAHLNVARPVNDWPQFCRDYFPENAPATDLAHAVCGFFQNGGSRCYVVNTGKAATVAGDARKGSGILALETYDEIAMLLAPGYTDPVSQGALVDLAKRREDCIAILDCVSDVDNVAELTEPATVSAPADGGDKADAKAANKSTGKGPPRSDYAACYYPNIVVKKLDGEGVVAVPPSGHIAGIYAMNDARRGVHRAPANLGIAGAAGLERRLTHAQQGLLNSKGINCIRHFRDRGIKVWGARTLSNSPQWRYVNVRRLYMMIRESLIDGCQWAVFNPNDHETRMALTFTCNAFLKRQWNLGALVGATQEEAFFVQCDETNNPPETVEAGILNVDIGISPSRPAEFIMFRLGLTAASGDEADA
ncbi:MAG: phage tail sheath subtilisin-like domain-containing protein [Pseudomonadota bacterium]